MQHRRRQAIFQASKRAFNAHKQPANSRPRSHDKAI